MSKNITHEGIVTKVEGQQVTVRFVRNSACSSCKAKSLCSGGTSESEERTVTACSYGVQYEPGDVVRIVVGSGLAWSAVVIAFVVPLVLALVCLFVVVKSSGNQLLGSVVTLLVLAVYYFVVWLQRHRLERRVEFTLERLY